MNTSALHVVEHSGPPDASLVVLVHGVLDSSDSFAEVAIALRDRYTVVTYDRRGWARSVSARGATCFTDHAADLIALMQNRRGIVIGHSYGGAVAMLAAALRPDLVAGLGLFEPYVGWTAMWPPNETILEQGPQEREQLRAGLQDGQLQTPAARARDHALMDAELALVADPPLDLRAIAAPCLVGRGELSVPWRVAVTDRLSQELGCALVVIEGGGHTSHRVRPVEFAAFVDRVSELGTRTES